MRIGFGYDVHQFTPDRKLWLGGIEVPCDRGLLGHSDADVAIPALCDAILGAAAMRDNDAFLAALREVNEREGMIAAICAAPIALDRAGLLEGKRFTCYPTTAQQIDTDATWVDEIVVRDGNFVFSQGPGTTLHFAYALVEFLGGDANKLREAMLYNKVLAA